MIGFDNAQANATHGFENITRSVGTFEACRFLEATVAMAYRLPLAELRARTRSRAPAAFARQVTMYVAHVGLGLTLTEVGRQFDRDRTTAAHACRVIEERREDPGLDRKLCRIERAIADWERMILHDFWGEAK